MSTPVILLGGGGHARVLLDALPVSVEVIGYVDPVAASCDMGVRYLGTDEELETFSVDEVSLINGVGNIVRRQALYNQFKLLGFHFFQVIHPSALISKGAVLAEGVQVMAGAVIQTGAKIGENVIVNTRASIDHDCSIGMHCHIAVGSVLAGDIQVGERVLMGAGSVVIQNIKIGDDAVVGAGAAVVHDVPSGLTVLGVPAQKIN